MFIYALIIFSFPFLVESISYQRTNIPCKTKEDCPPSVKFVWICKEKSFMTKSKEKFCAKVTQGIYYGPDAKG
ncbi:unnamed protein product [Trifolium pratense]|uniref:Uncharacterized protein n=1 Tax=Trifolium pratense TaxID=57577 RepID=A0ACB0KEV9_TRIPR|nr:unnamed protein product [Trifolium pratense]